MTVAVRTPLPAGRRLARSGPSRGLASGGRAALAVWSAYVLLSAVDCLTTAYALAHHLRETNPIAAAVFRAGGDAGLWAYKFAVLAVMMPLLVRLRRPVAIAVLAGMVALMLLDDLSNITWVLRAG
jgi:hypothetical protein